MKFISFSWKDKTIYLRMCKQAKFAHVFLFYDTVEIPTPRLDTLKVL